MWAGALTALVGLCGAGGGGGSLVLMGCAVLIRYIIVVVYVRPWCCRLQWYLAYTFHGYAPTLVVGAVHPLLPASLLLSHGVCARCSTH